MAPRILAEDAAVPMRDGTLLATDVFLADDGQPHPVLLVRTPYGRASARSGQDPIALARDGWAVVIQDVRGRWDSAGVFDPFRQEVDDGADAVAWCARQPWCTGAVVMAGASYDGLTQWLAALSGRSNLRAISPTVSSPYVRDSWVHPDGALNLGFLANWGIGLGMLGTGPGGAINHDALGRLDQWEETVRADRATDLITETFPQFATWLGEASSEFWTALEPSRPLARMAIPAFHLTGWFDIFCEGALDAYCALARPDGAPQRLVVGPWTHGQVFGTTAGELDLGMAASGFARFPAEQRQFLRDAATGAPPTGGVSVYIMGKNAWVDLPAWPPPSSETTWYLDTVDGGRVLSRTVPAVAGTDRWRHDPGDPVPTRGGRTLHPGLRIAGPVDQGKPERPDVLSYVGEPLDHEIVVAGKVQASVLFETTAAVTDLTAKLIDVHPDGRSFNVVDSATRVTAAAGTATWATVDLGSTAHAFRPGHRLRLDLASTNFPRFDRTPAADQAVHYGPRAPSRLSLRVLDASLVPQHLGSP